MRRGKGGNMNNNLWSLITAFLKQRMRTKRWRRAVTCLAAVIVFGVTYALILPAITMTGKYPVLSAETLTAWTGDELTVKVSAETAPEDGGKIIVLTLEGEGADLSQNYAFNEEGVCIILDEAQNEIELHRAVRDKVENTVDYWFAMEPGTQTVFTLNLADEVDAARFAETMEAVKLSGEEMAAEAEKATASDAGKSAAVQTEKKETGKATPADAEKKAEVKKASASNADVAEANKIAENSEEKIETESRDEGFVEILDGAVINDLEADEDEEEEQTEIVAELKVSAGVGDDYENAVKDAAKNADKRGDAQLKFQWKDVVAKQAEAPELVSYLNGATIAVFYDEKAGIPAGAVLSVTEIEEGTDEYAEYLAQAKSAVDKATGSDASRTVTQARFFDITILDEEGEEVEPQAAVKVVITYEEAVELSSDGDLNVVHFKDDNAPEIFAPVKSEAGQDAVDALSFTTDSFSVYGVVGTGTLTAKYFTVGGDAYEVTVTYNAASGIPEGSRLVVSEVMPEDQRYASYVEQTAEKVNSDKTDINYIKLLDISIVDDNGTEIQPGVPVDVQIRLLDKKTEEAEDIPGTTKIVHFGEEAEVLESVSEGEVVNFKAEGFSVYAVVTINDVLDLDTKSYGLLNTTGGNSPTGFAMMSTITANTRLSGKTTTVRVDTIDRVNYVYVAQNSEISMWTFGKADDSGHFYVTTVTGSGSSAVTKYLKIGSGGLALVDAATGLTDPDCKITVTKGTGANNGKYKLSTGNGTLAYDTDKNQFYRVAAGSTVAACWMNFAELSTLNDDDFVVYTATKVSVSGTATTSPTSTSVQLSDGTYMDYDVNNGDYVVLYTRIWNDTEKKYDYYAVDYDGMLVKAYESGDTISWVGSKVPTMLWKFTEYYYEGTENPNYYYELQNDNSNKYIAPKKTPAEGDTDILSASKIGLNLNGRRYKEYYSTILAWDKASFSYRTLKVDEEGELDLVSAPMSQAADFYFAKMSPASSTQELKPVSTLDHTSYGIRLKMQDYGTTAAGVGNNGNNFRCVEQDDLLGFMKSKGFCAEKDLVKKYLEEGEGDDAGFPRVVKNGRSLHELFDETFEVNQQFLLTTYEETGYFEYDSTKNFAHVITSTDDYWYGKEKPGGGTYGLNDFVVYEQLGTTSEDVTKSATRMHGQFFPFNDIQPENGNSLNTTINALNTTDIHGYQLSTLDPRRGEKLNVIDVGTLNKGKGNLPYVDTFFGMEMTADFMQSASGQDEWGHDLIFEFSGDDDFWLYIDGLLVLDLGGVHSAIDASINFKTGVVKQAGTSDHAVENSNLRTLYTAAFKQKYKDEHGSDPTDDQVKAFLDGGDDPVLEDVHYIGYFENGGTVFKDFSGHDMHMFYMERGAGASNLHMRFNLAPYVAGQVQLEKEVSGSDNITTPFPYQIYYENESHVMAQVGSDDDDFGVTVFESDGVTPRERGSYPDIDGNLYENVFFVYPGETVLINLPSEDTHYCIRECGVNSPGTFDWVKVNGADPYDDLPPEDEEPVPEQGNTKNFWSDNPISVIHPDDHIDEAQTVRQRKKVIFENHVSSDALKNLTVTKRLWQDDNKTNEITDDPTLFRFRIYIGKETSGEYKVYDSGTYFVKDPDGNYCDYSERDESFVPYKKNDQPVSDFAQLSDADIEEIVQYTSPGGQADNIQAGYSIEIRGLLSGTPYMVLERDNEIPAGYQLIDYTLTEGKYDPDTYVGTPTNEAQYEGAIDDDKSEETVSVHNKHGYGLILDKVWTDKDFMESHDPVYFAVYVGDSTEPLADSVRKLTHPATSISWFFEDLADGAASINDYKVYEVKLDGTPVENPDTKVVSGYTSIERIEDGGVNLVGADDGIHSESYIFEYTVNYDFGTAKDGANSKTDTVTNSRPGIRLVKTDMAGEPLEGAVFTLSKVLDKTKTFTSDENGLIAMAYLEPYTEENQKVYTLKEVSTPEGYMALIDEVSLKVTVDDQGVYTVYIDGSPEDPASGYYHIEQMDTVPTAEEMPTVVIKNRPYTLKAKKIDGLSEAVIEGVHFALYKEVFAAGASGEPDPNKPMPFYRPMEGFEDMVTNDEGIIEEIVLKDADHPNGLVPGNYYLREKETPAGYNPLGVDIRIMISETGEVTLMKATAPGASGGDWVIEDVEEEIATVGLDDDEVMLITVKNKPNDPIRIKKLEEGTVNPLANVEFELYEQSQVVPSEDGKLKPKDGEQPLVSNRTDENGLLYLDGFDIGDNITYVLFETDPLDGYVLVNGPVLIVTSREGDNLQLMVTLADDTHLPCELITDEHGNKIWEITVYNSKGVELPRTGGPGTLLYTLGGMMLLIFSAVLYGFRMRHGERRFE